MNTSVRSFVDTLAARPMSVQQAAAYRADIDAFEHTAKALFTLVTIFGDEALEARTLDHGRTVRDVVIEVITDELRSFDQPFPKNMYGASAAKLLELYRVTVKGRLRQLNGARNPSARDCRHLRERVTQVWLREQDVRDAVDCPGNADSPAALRAMELLGELFGAALTEAVEPASIAGVGIEVRIFLSGQCPATIVARPELGTNNTCVALHSALTGSPQSEPVVALPPPSDASSISDRATLEMTSQAFVRIVTGRVRLEDIGVHVTGSRVLRDAVRYALTIDFDG